MSIDRPFRRLAAVAFAAAFAAAVLLGPLDRPAAAATPNATADTAFLALLNTLRVSLGLPTVTLDPQLSGVAEAWSVKMADSGVMSHNPSLVDQVPKWANLAENVGFGDGGVNQIFNALVASPPHMRNMSEGAYTLVGIGTVVDASGRMWTTHVFFRPAAATTARAAAPPTTKVIAPATTGAPKPTTTTTLIRPQAAPATVRPPTTTSTLASVTTAPPSPTVTVRPAPGVAPPIEVAAASLPSLPPVLPVASRPEPGTPAPLVGVGVLIALLVLLDIGWLQHRSASAARHDRAAR